MQFQGHDGQTRSLGQPQLSYPSDLPCSSISSTFLKLTNIQAWICEYVFFNNSQKHHHWNDQNGSYCVCWQHGISGHQDWTVSFVLHAQMYLSSLRIGDTILWQNLSHHRIIGSGNGSSPDGYQAIVCTKDMLSMGPSKLDFLLSSRYAHTVMLIEAWWYHMVTKF